MRRSVATAGIVGVAAVLAGGVIALAGQIGSNGPRAAQAARDQQVAQAVSDNVAPGQRSDTNDSEQPVPASDAERAAQAALKATGGGTVHDVDRDTEGGAIWEVEITRTDGKAVEVLLDKEFLVLSVGDEQEANEGVDDADDKRGDDDGGRDDK